MERIRLIVLGIGGRSMAFLKNFDHSNVTPLRWEWRRDTAFLGVLTD